MNAKIDIEISDLTISYGEIEALKNITFTIRENDFVGIIGPNGGGKSTLIKSLLGLLEPKKGSIRINGNKEIAYVPQFAEFDRKFPISVEEVIKMGLIKSKSYFFKKYTDNELDKFQHIVNKLNIQKLIKKQLSELSGGQLQKVLVARALISDPGILLLDEPTANLDVKTKNDIYSMLKVLSKDITILIITHDIAEIFSYATSVAYINKTLHYHGRDTKTKRNVIELATGCSIEELVVQEETLKQTSWKYLQRIEVLW